MSAPAMTTPSERDLPILFSAPMISALLEGRKTQTRRTSKRWAEVKAGDRLWCRESFYLTDNGHEQFAVYAADELETHEHITNMTRLAGKIPDDVWARHVKLRPSIHMPRWASRLTLVATADARVEWLKDITDADAIAEGATSRPACYGWRNRSDGWSMDWSKVGHRNRFAEDGRTLTERDIALGAPRWAFGSLWEELHGDGSFDVPTEVVVLTFRVITQNIDTLARAA